MTTPATPVVAIMNTSEEVTTLLDHLLTDEGFQCVTVFIPDLKRGEPEPRAFLHEHDPRVILYDIAIPYEENWRFFQEMRASDAAQGRRFVLTTTNKQALEGLVGPTGTHELVGRPFDLDEIVQAVRRALA